MDETQKNGEQSLTKWQPTEWDQARIDLARKAVTPPTATPAEFEFFIAWCRRTGLDPFVKQAFLVERRAKDPRTNEWVTKHEPLAAESGMSAIADAQPDYGGIKAATVFEGDTFEVDEDAQKIVHKWTLEARKKAGNKVLGAWARSYRNSRTIPLVWLPIESRIQMKKDYKSGAEEPTSFWKKDPAGMILKCARAASHRLAYPNLFSGVYVNEEMEQVEPVESPTPTHAPSQPLPSGPSRSRAQEVADKLKQHLGADVKRGPAPAPTPQGPPGSVEEAPIPVVRRGTHKGKPISGLEAEELTAAIAEYETGLAKTPSPEGKAIVQRELDELKAEQQKRIDEAGAFQ